MTNGEKYKKAFSVLQTSKGSLQEVENMAKLQKRTKMKTAVAVIAGCIILGGTGTAYAANVGGIQRTVQIWLTELNVPLQRKNLWKKLIPRM